LLHLYVRVSYVRRKAVILKLALESPYS
jgi:hypothetical protein